MEIRDIKDGIEGIGANRIDSMRALLSKMAAQAQGPSSTSPLTSLTSLNNATTGVPAKTGAPSFAETLKNALNQANQVQVNAQRTSEQFIKGEGNISIADMLIEKEKANIGLQLTVQTRNKLVAAYNEVMGMQI